MADRRRADARVIFCEHDRRAVTLDCSLVHASDAPLPAGTPFSIRLRPPVSPLLERLIRAVMDDWALEERVIDVELAVERQRAILHDGSTSLCLELDRVRGLDELVGG